MTSESQPEIKGAVLAIVAAVPAGRVTTYRDIGEQLGAAARDVAYQLGRLTPEEADAAPWHRVVGDDGWLGAPKGDSAGRSQEDRLAEEGVRVEAGRVADFQEVRVRQDTREAGEDANAPAPTATPAPGGDAA